MNDLLRLEGVQKRFANQIAVNDVSFEVQEGEFISILGPSGCGKTTLLRLIMGLETPSAGAIYLNDIDITSLRPAKREFSIVFQDYALFPHMTLYENVAYGLKLRKIPKDEIHERVMSTLTLLKLEKSLKKYPSQLSGGMQQRAAIARSLVLNTKLLLLDEPFSALDAVVKVDLCDELRELQRAFKITMIMVTHDQEEAFSLSDRVILMNRGSLIAYATPKELYANRDNEFIKSFIIDQINKRARYITNLREAGNNET